MTRTPKTLAAALPLVGLLLIAGCGGAKTDTKPQAKPATEAKSAATSTQDTTTATPSDTGAALDAVLAGAQRGDGHRNRDKFRHPKETLQFFGIAPSMTVVEVFPGGGWYTKVIAPYLATGGGTYIALQNNPGDNQRRIDGLAAFTSEFSDTSVYGKVEVALLGDSGPAVTPGTADVVVTFRNVHNWMGGGVTDKMFAEFYSALKPGGVLGVVEHRGDPAVEQDPRGATGYVREDAVMAMAAKAGFELESKSEINANPADTKDHPFGVWTLPPVKRSSSTGAPDPTFDGKKYDAIGESDRMTLKFRKPNNADGALLE